MALKTREIGIISEYRELIEGLPGLIKESGLKATFIREKTNISRMIYEYRMKEKNWQPDELEDIIRVIEGKEPKYADQRKKKAPRGATVAKNKKNEVNN